MIQQLHTLIAVTYVIVNHNHQLQWLWTTEKKENTVWFQTIRKKNRAETNLNRVFLCENIIKNFLIKANV